MIKKNKIIITIEYYTTRWDRTDKSGNWNLNQLNIYGRRVGDSWDATRFTSNYTSEIEKLLWSNSTYLLCWKLLRFTSTVFKEQYLLVILFRKINQFKCDKRFITFVQMGLYPQKTCKSLVLFTNANMHT